MIRWTDIAAHISAVSGSRFEPATPGGVGGGCINSAFLLDDGRQRWFIKTNRAGLIGMFEAEADGLNELAASDTIVVPRALCTGVAGDVSYIVMDHITFGRAAADSWREAGRQLAALHRTHNDRYGWHRDNTIGATPQHNDRQSDWVTFWRDQRLGFQLAEAARNGYGGRLQALGDRLLACFPALLDQMPQPSLLHGDLWGGNISFTSSGEPAIYDPATYYGDREAELAMTELFGGFDPDFYAAYREAWPLAPGYPLRRTLYNLYHVINHLNLFGGGYGRQAEHMMQQLLAEC